MTHSRRRSPGDAAAATAESPIILPTFVAPCLKPAAFACRFPQGNSIWLLSPLPVLRGRMREGAVLLVASKKAPSPALPRRTGRGWIDPPGSHAIALPLSPRD